MVVSLFSYVVALPGRVVRRLWYSGIATLSEVGSRVGLPIIRAYKASKQFSAWQKAERISQRKLAAEAKQFLASTEILELPSSDCPTLSLVLTLDTNPGINFAALRALAALGRALAGEERIEVFLIGAPDTAGLGRFRGAVSVTEQCSGLYLRLAEQARGDRLLFLGSGGRFLDSSEQGRPIMDSNGATGVRAALRRLGPGPDGTVTGRLLAADGRLLPTGLAADAPAAMFEREVEECNADALFVWRETFLRLGGFGSLDDPTGSGETRGAEWGRRTHRAGGRVIYSPELLAYFPLAKSASINPRPLATHGCRKVRARVLLVEDQTPYPWLGAGYPRSAELLAALVAADCAVTLYPALHANGSWPEVRTLVDRRVEVMLNHDWIDFPRFWRERADYYDLCIVCRPHNMARLRRYLFRRAGGPPVVYDAEALCCLRTLAWRRHTGRVDSPAYARRMIAREVRLAEGSAAVLAVSEREASKFREFLADDRRVGCPPRFYVLRHKIPGGPTPAGFDERHGYLFVGTLHAANTPNADSVEWFLREIFPLLPREAGDKPPVFRLAGTNSAGIKFSTCINVEILGRVDDLNPVYNAARVFVAPTRFSAGVPLKVYEAAACGVPIVLTPLLAEQLDWQTEKECLVAEEPAAFAQACQRLHGDRMLWMHLREGALRRVELDCSAAKFRATVEQMLTENLAASPLN